VFRCTVRDRVGEKREEREKRREKRESEGGSRGRKIMRQREQQMEGDQPIQKKIELYARELSKRRLNKWSVPLATQIGAQRAPLPRRAHPVWMT
jgi:hypothetical protein